MNLKKVLWQTPLIVLIALVIIFITDALNLSFLQTDLEEKLFTESVSSKDFTLVLFTLVTLIPILALIEEFIFRYIPYKLWNKYLKNKVNYWFVGLLSSVLFAVLVHTNFTNGIELPLPQMVLGLYLWHIIRYKNGYKLATFAHFYFNVLLTLGAYFIYVVIS